MPLSPAKVRPSSTQCSFLGGGGERVFRAGCGPSLRRAHLFSMRFAPPSEGGPVSREIFRCEEERFVSTLRAGRKGRAGGMHFRRKSDRSVHVPPSVQRVPGEAPLRRTALAWLCLCVAQAPERHAFAPRRRRGRRLASVKESGMISCFSRYVIFFFITIRIRYAGYHKKRRGAARHGS